MSECLGDFPINGTVQCKWSTSLDGESITRATNGTLRVYKNASVTQRTSAAGITETEDFDTITGVHHITIDLADNTDAGFYAAGNEYQVVMIGMVISTATVNAVIAHFSIERAGGVLAVLKSVVSGVGVNVTQLAGVTQSLTDLKDFADDGYDPATNKVQGVVLTDTLTTYTGNTLQTGDSFARIGATGSGLTSLATQASVTTIDDFLDTEVAAIKVVTDALPNAGALTTIQADLDNIQTRLPSALVTGRIDASVGAMAADVVTAAAIATDAIGSAELAASAITEIQAGLSTLDAAGIRTATGLATANLDTQLAAIQSDTDNMQTRLPTALVSGRIDASVGAMTANTLTATAIATDAITAAKIATDAVTEIQSGLATAATLALVQADTDDMQTRLPAALVAGRIDASVGALNGSTAAAQNLERSASSIYRGSITATSTSTSLVDSGLTQSGTDHWKGRVVIFTSGALAGQATDILAFTPGTDALTVTTLTAAPATSDEFVIV